MKNAIRQIIENKHFNTNRTTRVQCDASKEGLRAFKNYLYGSRFTLQTDHQALLLALNDNRGNKTYQSRLKRWVDRQLPFNFSVKHIAGKNMRFADYFSRHPTSSTEIRYKFCH